MANANDINPAIEQFQKQLLNVQQMYYPTVINQINSIDLKQIFGPWEKIQLESVQFNIPFALTQFIEQLDKVNQILQPNISNIVLNSVELANTFNAVCPKLQDQLAQIKNLHYNEFSEYELYSLEEINNEIKQISNVTKTHKSFTWMQLRENILFIIAILGLIPAYIDNPQLEQIHQDIQTLIQLTVEEATRDENFQQQFLENQEKQIDLLEKHLELNQCDCSKHD